MFKAVYTICVMSFVCTQILGLIFVKIWRKYSYVTLSIFVEFSFYIMTSYELHKRFYALYGF